jgi:hypothetical protein
LSSLFEKLFFSVKILSVEDTDIGPIIGEEEAKELYNRPQNLKEVKSLAVAKTLLNTFCKQSEKHKEIWEEYENEEENELTKDTVKQWEQQFNQWENVLSKESHNLDLFIEKHNDLLQQRADNMEKQYEWIKSIKDKLEN